MSHYKPYPEYKNSGVSWLGEVPSHWEERKLKWVFVEKKKKQETRLPPGAISFGEVVFKNLRNEDTQGSYQELLNGEFIINPINLNYDLKSLRVALSDKNVQVSPGYIVLNFKKCYAPRFLRWMMYVFDVSYMKSLGAGIRQTITFSDIGNSISMFPPIEEQHAIGNYIDRETIRIDNLITKKKRFIELLKERRQALINKAVTKGLDSDVPMKNSGVEWIGEIPVNWTISPLRWYSEIQSGVTLGGKIDPDDSVDVPYLRVANVQDGHLNLDDVYEISLTKNQVSRFLLKDGDVLMNEGGDNDKLGRGAVWRCEIDRCVHQNHVFAVRPFGNLTPDWLALYTSSHPAKAHFRVNAKQSTNLASISSRNIKDLCIPLPPLSEQRAILERISKSTGRIDALVDKTSKSIDLLYEHRAALITAAVTGKIDLRSEVESKHDTEVA